MKKLWGRSTKPQAPMSGQFVTRDELPGLVRRILVEALTQKVIVQVAPAVVPEAAPESARCGACGKRGHNRRTCKS